ncbi:unnamed protein product [Tuber melanosporum]|uniref:(Perigord truffle) hypothetical protein n=1 Tax=Tuber melanosporum (strain Mel28) TaxID=656061 RepID=D5G4W7_TUBMM|nr:uncharacterized protein GSTUM_00000124001 [Tuber melanosporum]CAZ79560.1 unnamed protein product [Tuber melanosporum]
MHFFLLKSTHTCSFAGSATNWSGCFLLIASHFR